MDTRSSRSASPTLEASNSLTQFLDAVEDLWPGSTRIARLIAQHGEWLKRKYTNGVSWYDIITSTMDENHQPDDEGDEIVWDAD
jgi:hypothetical protein